MRPASGSLRAALFAMLAAGCLSLAAGCGRPGPAEEATGIFHGSAPHGGTVVSFGGGDYSLELVLDRGSGTLSAYLLDDDLENFVRSPDRSVRLRATAGGQSRTLDLAAVANPATGETVGDTSLFQGHAGWLRGPEGIDGVLESVTVRGSSFSGLNFRLPPGKDGN